MEAEQEDAPMEEDELSYHDCLPDDVDDHAGYPEPEDADVPFVEEDGYREHDPMPELDPQVKAVVRRAHANLGHPGRAAFVRILRLGGAPQEAIEYAQKWACPI